MGSNSFGPGMFPTEQASGPGPHRISDAMNINGHRYVLREDYDVLAARCAELEKAIRDADTAVGKSEGIGLSRYMQQLQMDASIAVIDACIAGADPGCQS